MHGVPGLEPVGTLGEHHLERRTDDPEGRAPFLSGGEQQVLAHRVGVRGVQHEPGTRLHLEHRGGDPHLGQRRYLEQGPEVSRMRIGRTCPG